MGTLATGLLGSVILSGKASAVVSTIGTDLIIQTVTTTTSSIGSLIKYLTTSNQTCIQDILIILRKIDLEFTISIINELVKEQNGKQLNQSVKKALVGVHEILDRIDQELTSIKKAIEYHNTKYFAGWRGFSWNGNIDLIKEHDNTLKHRYMILVDLLEIYNKSVS